MNTKRVVAFSENTPIMRAYYNDIRKIPLLSREEESSLIDSYLKNRDQETKNKLINANQRFVVSVAKKFVNNNNDILLDLINEGNIGLITAIEKFDPSMGFKFITYAVWYIRREIQAYLMNNRLIDKTNLQKTIFYVDEIKDRIMKKECREATENEIIKALDRKYDIQIIDEGDLYELKISSLDVDIDVEDNRDATQSLFNQKFYTRNNIECIIGQEDDKETVKDCMKILLEREQKIIKLHFGIGLDRQYDLDEIGISQGVSSERVRQIICDSIELMQIWVKERRKRRGVPLEICMKILSSLEKHIFKLHFFKGYTLEQISKTVDNIDPEGIRKILMESIRVISNWIDSKN